jgi:hypothetical protein
MADIFKPGTGTNSGKLTFRTLTPIFPIYITASCTSLTINSLSGFANSVAIPTNYIVIGTGTSSPGITYSTFQISDQPFRKGIFGVQQISPFGHNWQNGPNVINSSKVKYSFLIGDVYNSTLTSSNVRKDGSIIINSSSVCQINSTRNLVAASNVVNSYASVCCLTSLSNNDLETCKAVSPFVISSYCTCVGPSRYSSIISSCRSYIHKGMNTTEVAFRNNTILSAYNSCIDGGGTNVIFTSNSSQIKYAEVPSAYLLKNNFILSSKSAVIDTSGGGDVTSNLIMSSRNSSTYKGTVASSVISSEYTNNLTANFSVLMATCQIYGNSQRGAIISSERIYQYGIVDRTTVIGSTCIKQYYGSYNNSVIASCCAKFAGYGHNNILISSKGVYGNPYDTNCFKDNNGVIISSKNSTVGTQSSNCLFNDESCSQKIVISGVCNTSNFLSIAGAYNFALSLSTVIGGYCNRSGRTSDLDYNLYKGNSKYEKRYGPHSGFIIGGHHNVSSANSGGMIINGTYNYLINTIESSIISSNSSAIRGKGCYAGVGVHMQNSIFNSFIISSDSSFFQDTSGVGSEPTCPAMVKNSGIISSANSTLNTCGYFNSSPNPTGTYTRSQVILGSYAGSGGVNPSIGSLYNYSITVQNLVVACCFYSMTASTCCVGITGGFTNPSFICIVNGLVTCVG